MKRELVVILGLLAGMAEAETAPRPWEGEAQLTAYSKTAMSITGDIALSGPAEARKVTFTSGAAMGLALVGEVTAIWSLTGSEASSAAVYEVTADPGPLLNGNTLCGATTPARFVVFSAEADFVQMAVFSEEEPTGIDASDLCGTYNFSAD